MTDPKEMSDKPPNHGDEDALIQTVLEETRNRVKVASRYFKDEHAALRLAADQVIAEIDAKLNDQIDEILHHKAFQKLEAVWRSLKFLVDRTDFRENIQIEMLNVSKEDLLVDFMDAPEIIRSGLYKVVYTSEYGTFGGKPYAAIVADYTFGPNVQDMKLLQSTAAVAGMAHAPFIAAAGPEFFGEEDFTTLPALKSLDAVFQGPGYIKWRSFRASEDARYVGLTLPRFLLRLPYREESDPVQAFPYRERTKGKHRDYLWGNAAFTFATRLIDSFSKYRWCPHIIGPASGGEVKDLVVEPFEAMAGSMDKIPLEILVSDRLEFELAELGFIPLSVRKTSSGAAFFSANSCQTPKRFGRSEEGREAEINYKLGTQLPYIFIITRLAHYLKIIQRENIGSWKQKTDLERELNAWLKQYVAEQDNPPPSARSRRPLRQASVTIEDVEGEAGWYRVGIKIKPHFKYMGAFFTLSLVGKMDKE